MFFTCGSLKGAVTSDLAQLSTLFVNMAGTKCACCLLAWWNVELSRRSLLVQHCHLQQLCLKFSNLFSWKEFVVSKRRQNSSMFSLFADGCKQSRKRKDCFHFNKSFIVDCQCSTLYRCLILCTIQFCSIYHSSKHITSSDHISVQLDLTCEK